MLRKIIFFAIHQPLFVFLILVLFIGAGIFAFQTLPIEAFPDVTDIQVTVVTLYPGHAAEEVEKQVTIPLEIALSGLPHSVRLFSHTQFGLSSTYITFDDEADNYFARQDLTGLFLGIDANIAQKYRIALGARREKNDQAVTTFALSNPEAPPVVAGEDTRSTLPAAAFTWAYSDDAQLRLSYAKTLSRPDFRELSPAPYLDPLLDVQVIGNPDLVSAGIRNYDLRWEYYFSPVESLSIGYFLKEFEDPIEKTRLPGSGVLLSLDNAQSARNYGIELDVSKGLEFVADWPGFRSVHGDWANWSVGFNYARIKSSIQLDPLDASFQTNLNRPMQGQSPYVANLQLGHHSGDGSREATLLYNVSGRRIAAVGVAGQPDIYEEAFRQLDFQYRRELGEDWSFKLRLRNLLDPAVRYTQGAETTREYRKGRSLLLTLEWKPQ